MTPYEMGRKVGRMNGSIYENPFQGIPGPESQQWYDGLVVGWHEGGHLGNLDAEQDREAG